MSGCVSIHADMSRLFAGAITAMHKCLGLCLGSEFGKKTCIKLFFLCIMHCFCSPCRGPIYAFSGGLRFGNAWMVPCLQNEDVKPPMKQPQPVILVGV